MSPADFTRPRPDRVAAQRNRDRAMARITRVRGLVVLGAGALTAAVAAVVSAVAPGHTLAKGSTHPQAVVAKRGAAGSVRTAGMPPLASARQLGLRAPGSTPQPAPSVPTPSAPAQSAPSQSGSQSAPSQTGPSQSSAPPSQPAPAAVSGGS